ncbi:mannitol operon transcriptional antiterminator [Hespellia stercorisuis DSM 15480]|uniref:Mannitol operon transcriptional antiterminator n=2 Tax=Hespellia stercorisuis TaxID=180311 RepID=A0A1M6U0X8_9FIRM|nr:mannitol operon transcriptional antiterminator [Hespellia stercorisuis DSM 15480]
MLTVLLQEDTPVSVKYLAEQVGVSKRTMQRELEYIDSDLRGYPITFKSKTGVGVWLEGTKEDKEQFLSSLDENKDNIDMMNKEERRKRLILEILKDKGLKKLFHYSSQFQVSEATISNDLEAVEEWLNQQNLRVVRKPGSGVLIEGVEEDYRKAIRVFIGENMNADFIKESYELQESGPGRERGIEKLKKSEIGQVLNEDILGKVVNTVISLNDARVLNLTENAYVGLVLHISIAINRILKGEVLGQNEALIADVAKDKDFELAEEIVEALEAEFEIVIPEMEIYYICLHIKGAKHQKIELDSRNSVESETRNLQRLVNEMIDAFDEELAYLLKQDDEFIQGLLAHLQPTVIRIRYHMQIQNPVLQEIKESYQEVYEKCRKVAEVLGKWIGKPVPDAETGFLAVHFGAALVRLEDRREIFRQVTVGVVCASGIGISRLMASKIEKAFKNRVQLVTYGKGDLTPFILSSTDFFVSSIAVEETQGDVIFVNPLLNDEDMEHIRDKVRYYERTPKEKQESPASLQLEETNFVAHQIHLIVDHMGYFAVNADIRFEDLVEQIGDRMAGYEDQKTSIVYDILNREKLGTQIFAEFGFGLLHTRTEGVTRPEFAVCRPVQGNQFQDPYFKGIQVVLVMLIPVDEHIRENSDILGFISSTMIEDESFLDTMLTGDVERMKEHLLATLKIYFYHYLGRL